MDIMKLAQYTVKLNSERKQITADDMKLIYKLLQNKSLANVHILVIVDKRLHPQTVGIEASRLTEKYHVPALVAGHLAGTPDNIFRGSGRSVGDFNLFTVMNPIRKDMASFGGHAFACGFSIEKDKINKFRKDINRNAKDFQPSLPTVHPDLLLTPNDINLKLVKQLQKLEPFGQDNPEPLVYVQAPHIFNVKCMGVNTLGLRCGNYVHSIKGVGFKMGQKLAPSLRTDNKNVGIIGYLKINTFRNRTNVEINIKHIVHYEPQLDRLTMINLYRHLVLLNQSNHKLTFSNLMKAVAPALSLKTVKNGLRVFNELHLVRHPFSNLSLVSNPEQTSLLNSALYRKLSI